MKKTLPLLIFSGIFFAGCSHEIFESEKTPNPHLEILQEASSLEPTPELSSSAEPEIEFVTQQLESLGLEITYPQKWGDVSISSENNLDLLFSKKKFRPVRTGFFGGGDEAFKIWVFDPSLIVKKEPEYNIANKWVDNPYYFEYIKNQIDSKVLGACEQVFIGGDFLYCNNEKFISINSQKYLSTVEWGHFLDDDLLYKKYITLVGDKMVIVFLRIDKVPGIVNQDSGTFEAYSDISQLNKEKFQEIDESVIEFFSNITFKNTRSDSQVFSNIKKLKKIQNKIEIRNLQYCFHALDCPR
jgi:hypothetical protein